MAFGRLDLNFSTKFSDQASTASLYGFSIRRSHFWQFPNIGYNSVNRKKLMNLSYVNGSIELLDYLFIVRIVAKTSSNSEQILETIRAAFRDW